MKKETGIALFLGVLFGIGVALFFIFSTKEKTIDNKKIISAPSVTITPMDFKNATFDITSPANEYVTDKNSVTIKGRGAKDALIIFSSPTSEKAIKMSTETFSVDFPVSTGENQIKITSYAGTDVEERTLKIYLLD